VSAVTATVESAFVESVTTDVESVFTSVDVEPPQEASAKIDTNATIFFIIVFFVFLYNS